ncbi:MAG: hypothetical protein ACJA2X_002358 [Halocynthiibacter sp.]|jgi:uncharacterized protein (DUF433 family)
MTPNNLIGIGLYTPIEAQRLLGVSASKIGRWLSGHERKGVRYAPLWEPQIDLNDGAVYLGFRDLMEVRAANQFLDAGVSPQAVRRAIIVAQEYVDAERPLSTTRFKTDGRSIFLEIAEGEGDKKLLDLFKKQYAFSKIMERSLKDVEFDGITPSRWWIGSQKSGVVLDPQQSFGQPIEHETGIPTVVLAKAVEAEGSVTKAAKAWCVERKHVQRAVDFERSLTRQAA